MAAGIYKPGQGYWTRMLSAIAAGTLAVSGGMWASQQLARLPLGDVNPLYIQGAGLLAVVVPFGLVVYWLIGRKKRSVDFLVATEGEMRKVNWSTRKEVMGSTWVVIGVSIIITAVLLLADVVFSAIFKAIGVLQ